MALARDVGGSRTRRDNGSAVTPGYSFHLPGLPHPPRVGKNPLHRVFDHVKPNVSVGVDASLSNPWARVARDPWWVSASKNHFLTQDKRR